MRFECKKVNRKLYPVNTQKKERGVEEREGGGGGGREEGKEMGGGAMSCSVLQCVAGCVQTG